MNKVILIGRLTKDPELRTTSSNLSVATFSLAVARPYVAQNNNGPDADFINCVVWRKQAENLAKYCHKGSQIAVDGRIQTRNYQAQDGSKRYVTEVICDNITFLGSKPEGANNIEAPNYQNSYPEPIPNYQPIGGYQEPTPYHEADMPSTDLTNEDPFKDFGEEVTLSDDDLPF